MKADICLILEGTYPYVHGGVSSWIHEIVTSMQEFTFSIVHISATGDVMHVPKYNIPPNIIEFREAFIHDFKDDKSRTSGTKGQGWRTLKDFYDNIETNDFSRDKKFYDMIINKETRRLNIHDIMYSRQAWNMMVDFHERFAPRVSFIDFYWTMRLMHIPIFNIFNTDIPDASVYHTVCTGYAGLLASIASVSKKAPLILTEHGIYTYERKIDISRSAWIYSEAEKQMRATRTLGFFKDLWIKKFEILSRITYEHADSILTLFEGNRRLQVEGGADPDKCRIIPNGVHLEGKTGRTKKPARDRKNIGFAGRIVSIKDVKMLIRAMKIVKQEMPDIKVYIMGSMDEEPEYAEECKALVGMLELQDNVIFTGVVDVNEYYPRMDVVVLTSISEAQPLSMLEAMSAGIPVVATDVGSCRELIRGNTFEDRAMGESGIVTRVGDSHNTASAVLSILHNDEMSARMGAIGAQRVNRYYTVGTMVKSYKRLYGDYLRGPVRG